MSVAVVNVKILDGDLGYIERGGLLIDDQGLVAAVEANYTPPAGVSVVDGAGLWCLPGFVDAHSHIGLSTRGESGNASDSNEATEAATPDVRALDGLNPQDPAIGDTLAAGVTTSYVTMGSANVIGGIGCTVHLHGRTVEDMVLVPAAGMKAAMGENPRRVHGGAHRRPQTRPGVAAVLREWLERARRYAMAPPSGPRDYNPKLEAMAMVIKGDIPLRVHCHRADDIATAHRVASEFGIRWVMDHATEAHFLLAEAVGWGVPAVVGPTFGSANKAETRHKNFAAVGQLARAGIPTAICSDHPVIPSQYLPIYAGLAVRAGMPEDLALRAITSVPARIVGVGDRLGSLAPGLLADFSLFTENPLTHIHAQARGVYIAGRQVAGA
jgi:imidazolonepropionase-like amidohydrolase